MHIKPYNEADDADALFALMRSEEEWAEYSAGDEAVRKYKNALRNSIVFVAYDDGMICGFVRAKDDDGFGVYILDLLVHKTKRGNGYGRLLMERVKQDFITPVYVMSDVDGYYLKQNYTKHGSIFTVTQ